MPHLASGAILLPSHSHAPSDAFDETNTTWVQEANLTGIPDSSPCRHIGDTRPVGRQSAASNAGGESSAAITSTWEIWSSSCEVNSVMSCEQLQAPPEEAVESPLLRTDSHIDVKAPRPCTFRDPVNRTVCWPWWKDSVYWFVRNDVAGAVCKTYLWYHVRLYQAPTLNPNDPSKTSSSGLPLMDNRASREGTFPEG